MFDDELPEDQCQLLARRLSRDDALKARWRRVRRDGRCDPGGTPGRGRLPCDWKPISRRASVPPSRLNPHWSADAVAQGGVRKVAGMRWWQPVAGGAITAGVAAMSVLWIRAQGPVGGESLVADNVAAPAAPLEPLRTTARPRATSYLQLWSERRSCRRQSWPITWSRIASSRRRSIGATCCPPWSPASRCATRTQLPSPSDDANVVEVARPNVEEASK